MHLQSENEKLPYKENLCVNIQFCSPKEKCITFSSKPEAIFNPTEIHRDFYYFCQHDHLKKITSDLSEYPS